MKKKNDNSTIKKKENDKELGVYAIFGACTTVVNLLSYKLLNTLLGVEYYLVSNAIAWLLSVIFAFVTNKIFVFKTKGAGFSVLIKEIITFVSGRVFSFCVEQGGLYLMMDLFKLKEFSVSISDFVISGNMISKVTVGIVVILLNYFISKFVVFRKKK